ncbi:hypothetical protein JR316_0008751 [Psilocybe cubensis]|uniref:Uncharacterized protein n=3 Tax=Psilocybe cubensis TaxID=181762 RepID=A0A8H8CHQ0_PSICU|nr:hypothetical protein JR316_0012770 [Psilocybe cubensis]XP_047745923.1 hypothetical protein JR316_0008751 [Psilocybe cubensis]KAH9474312.1 hypothetical protein JR316_0012770 [Psilocybe cubensis]KAH9478298.1 hypothetical protein JR316_0008751 [Psilocybe cubensis]
MELCANPDCRRDECVQRSTINIHVFSSLTPRLPFMWYIRAKNGHFVYGDDSHLCHLTRASEVPLLRAVRLGAKRFDWKEFDAFAPIEPEDFDHYMIFKCADVPDSSCYMIEHFLRRLHNNLDDGPDPEEEGDEDEDETDDENRDDSLIDSD